MKKSKISLDTVEVFPITPLEFKKPLRDERFLEKANTSFRYGFPDFHIPISNVFYIKSLLKEKLGYDIPIYYLEALLIEEKLLTKDGNVPKPPPSEEVTDKTQASEEPLT